MPELAEVEYYRRLWCAGAGGRIDSVELHAGARVFRGSDPVALQHIRGGVLAEGQAHGKQLMFPIDGVGWLGVHLGMTGELRIDPPGIDVDKHDHLVLRQRDRSLVFRDPRMFGRIRFVLGTNPPDWWTGLPPEILSPGFTKDRLKAFLARRRNAPLKALLLEQSQFPGIGNWMADEILWRGRWHPALTSPQLGELGAIALWKRTREVAQDALRVIAPDWGEAPDHWLFNHRWKAGGICPRPKCGAPLLRTDLRGRTSCWCPQCQDLASK